MFGLSVDVGFRSHQPTLGRNFDGCSGVGLVCFQGSAKIHWGTRHHLLCFKDCSVTVSINSINVVTTNF